MQRDTADNIYEIVNMIIDQIYFSDEELNILDSEIWIRPNKNSQSTFDEIDESETKITLLDMSTYIRSLLNEYARFPQYKRQAIVFDEELRLIDEACQCQKILQFKYNGTNYKLYAYQYVYGYLYDQNNYLIAYNINENQIQSFVLSKIKNPYILNKKFKTTENLDKQLQDFLEECNYDENNVQNIQEKYYENS